MPSSLLLLGAGKKITVAAGPSFTLVASNSGLPVAVTIPGTPTAGDLCIIWDVAQDTASTPATVTPSGFTILANVAGANSRLLIAAKKLVGGETTVNGMVGDNRDMWICATFNPSSAFTSFAAGGAVGAATAGDPASVNIAASGAPSLPVLLLGHMFGGGSAVDPRTTSPAMTEIAGGGTQHYAHYKIYNPGDTPLDHSYDLDDEGANNGNCACYLTITV